LKIENFIIIVIVIAIAIIAK